MIWLDYVFLLCPAQQGHTSMSSTVQEKGQASLEHLCLVLTSCVWFWPAAYIYYSLPMWRACASLLHQRHCAGTRLYMVCVRRLYIVKKHEGWSLHTVTGTFSWKLYTDQLALSGSCCWKGYATDCQTAEGLWVLQARASHLLEIVKISLKNNKHSNLPFGLSALRQYSARGCLICHWKSYVSCSSWQSAI